VLVAIALRQLSVELQGGAALPAATAAAYGVALRVGAVVMLASALGVGLVLQSGVGRRAGAARVTAS
jgi:hypothetical protein